MTRIVLIAFACGVPGPADVSLADLNADVPLGVTSCPVELVVLNSDLDLAALSEGRLDTVELTNRLIRALRVQAVDIADLSHADPLLMMLVARDGVLLYERSSGEFDRFASLAARRYADTKKFRAMEAQEIRDFIALGQSQP